MLLISGFLSLRQRTEELLGSCSHMVTLIFYKVLTEGLKVTAIADFMTVDGKKILQLCCEMVFLLLLTD